MQECLATLSFQLRLGPRCFAICGGLLDGFYLRLGDGTPRFVPSVPDVAEDLGNVAFPRQAQCRAGSHETRLVGFAVEWTDEAMEEDGHQLFRVALDPGRVDQGGREAEISACHLNSFAVRSVADHA